MLFLGTALGLVIVIAMTFVVLLDDDENSSGSTSSSASADASASPSATPGDSASASPTPSPTRTPSATSTATSTASGRPTGTASPSGGFQDSPVLAAAQARGHLVVGTKGDAPGLSFKDPATGEYTGFEIDLVEEVASNLGFDPDATEYRDIGSAEREAALTRGDIDLYIGTYSITALRKQTVGFAGPYYTAGLTTLVRDGEATIQGLDNTLDGRTVCTVTGSTPFQVLQSNHPQAQTTGRPSYAQCVDDLQASRVDAVVTDDAILRGYAAQRPSELKVVGNPVGVEKYGIGLDHDDAALRAAVNDALEEAVQDGSWSSAYSKNLDPTRITVPAPPPVERY
ncbi:glutamate ABC transporter substrate-binding protein [Streptomycetaceae bacterium NBC_01309]